MIRTLALLILAIVTIACERNTTPTSTEGGVVSYRILGRCDDPRDLRWTYLDAGEPDGLADLHDRLGAAVAIWNATGLVAMRRVDDEAAANVVVSWHDECPADCAPFLEWEGSLAHARGVARSTETAHIHLDSGRDWLTAPPAELRSVLVHELGHALGLDHSDDARAIMYPSADASRNDLGDSDRAALEALYGTGGVVGLDGPPFARAILDVDGDGLDEVLVWRVDAEATPKIQTFHLTVSGHVERTVGPWLSSIDLRRPGAEIVTLEGGGAALLQRHADGRFTAWGFDGSGRATVPWHRGRPLETESGPEDVDGDGILD